jgi:NAD(P)H-binding
VHGLGGRSTCAPAVGGRSDGVLPRHMKLPVVARTGRLIASELVGEGFDVSAMSFAPSPSTAGAHTVEGDIADMGAVRAAMSLVDAVVIAVESGTNPDATNGPHAVHLDGVEHVLAGASRAGIQIILITQVYDARPQDGEMARLIEWRKRGEQALRESSIAYTIVRPSPLTDETGGQRALRFEQGAGYQGQVSRANLARTCAQCLLTTASHCKTFDVYEDVGAPTLDWGHALAALARDAH